MQPPRATAWCLLRRRRHHGRRDEAVSSSSVSRVRPHNGVRRGNRRTQHEGAVRERGGRTSAKKFSPTHFAELPVRSTPSSPAHWVCCVFVQPRVLPHTGLSASAHVWRRNWGTGERRRLLPGGPSVPCDHWGGVIERGDQRRGRQNREYPAMPRNGVWCPRTHSCRMEGG